MRVEIHPGEVETIDDALGYLCAEYGDGTERHISLFSMSIEIDHYRGGYYTCVKTDQYKLGHGIFQQLKDKGYIELYPPEHPRSMWSRWRVSKEGSQFYWGKINDERRQLAFDKRAFHAVQT